MNFLQKKKPDQCLLIGLFVYQHAELLRLLAFHIATQQIVNSRLITLPL